MRDNAKNGKNSIILFCCCFNLLCEHDAWQQLFPLVTLPDALCVHEGLICSQRSRALLEQMEAGPHDPSTWPSLFLWVCCTSCGCIPWTPKKLNVNLGLFCLFAPLSGQTLVPLVSSPHPKKATGIKSDECWWEHKNTWEYQIHTSTNKIQKTWRPDWSFLSSKNHVYVNSCVGAWATFIGFYNGTARATDCINQVTSAGTMVPAPTDKSDE